MSLAYEVSRFRRPTDAQLEYLRNMLPKDRVPKLEELTAVAEQLDLAVLDSDIAPFPELWEEAKPYGEIVRTMIPKIDWDAIKEKEGVPNNYSIEVYRSGHDRYFARFYDEADDSDDALAMARDVIIATNERGMVERSNCYLESDYIRFTEMDILVLNSVCIYIRDNAFVPMWVAAYMRMDFDDTVDRFIKCDSAMREALRDPNFLLDLIPHLKDFPEFESATLVTSELIYEYHQKCTGFASPKLDFCNSAGSAIFYQLHAM